MFFAPAGGWRSTRHLASALTLGLLALPVAVRAADGMSEAAEALERLDAEVRFTEMTYVGSRDDRSGFVLRAHEASFRPDTKLAMLEDVRVEASHPDESRSFDVRCERGELDVETNNFYAYGDVRGTTGDGRSYSAPWVRYDHGQALLYTDAPVVMRDERGTFRGDGFRYMLKERRFKLLGNVRVVQSP